jgi:hypothetical protein
MPLRFPAHPHRFWPQSNSACFRSPSHLFHPWPHHTFPDTAHLLHYRLVLIHHRRLRKRLWFLHLFTSRPTTKARANLLAKRPHRHHSSRPIPCFQFLHFGQRHNHHATRHSLLDLPNQRGSRHPVSVHHHDPYRAEPNDNPYDYNDINVLFNTSHSLYNKALKGMTFLYDDTHFRHSFYTT